MKHGARFRGSQRPALDRDLDGALDALTVGELRSVVREALERLDREPRGELLDSLIARASKGSSGWKPSGPFRGVVGEVKRFVEAARRIGYAEPHDVDDYLRKGTNAFLAGEHATTREVFEALLPAIAYGDVDLGYHELVDEVLTVDVHECAARYVTAVYLTTPLEDRADALCQAIDALQEVACLWKPLEQMERVATGPLSELDAFLPRWVEHLERQSPSESEWDDDRDRWLREAVWRLEGVAGLERIARKTRKPQALRAWCEALAGGGEWAEALRAWDDAIKLAYESHWRGEFLDGAALAAQQLGRRDATRRLEAAWRGAPSLVRLLRWLLAGTASASTVVKRARKAIDHCPGKAGRQLGLLHLLTGDAHDAAKVLAKARGLGWSDEDHPGHLLFPAFAGLLAEGTRIKTKLGAGLFADLRHEPRDSSDMDREDDDGANPRLAVPSVAELIARARLGARIDVRDRVAMLKAMQAAARKRVAGILGNKRRRHYDHAAILVACCLELDPVAGKPGAIAKWVADLRRKYSRFYAFQKEVDHALAEVSS